MITYQKFYYVYILASERNGTLYIGFTSNLPQRIFEHKQHLTPGFTSKYNVDKLVYFERFEDVNDAIKHEKRLKNWHRNWKKDLIEKHNLEWRDIYNELNNLLLEKFTWVLWSSHRMTVKRNNSVFLYCVLPFVIPQLDCGT